MNNDRSGLSYDENGNPMGIPGPDLTQEQLQAKADDFDNYPVGQVTEAAQPTKDEQQRAAQEATRQKGRHRA